MSSYEGRVRSTEGYAKNIRPRGEDGIRQLRPVCYDGQWGDRESSQLVMGSTIHGSDPLAGAVVSNSKVPPVGCKP